MTQQTLETLNAHMDEALVLLKKWKVNGGDVDALSWVKINESLSVADVTGAIGKTLSDTSISLIKISGNIEPHKHMLSNSSGVVLSEAEGFLFIEGVEVYLGDVWSPVVRDMSYSFESGTVHGFRNVQNGNLFLLFLDSPPIDDEVDHIHVDI